MLLVSLMTPLNVLENKIPKPKKVLTVKSVGNSFGRSLGNNEKKWSLLNQFPFHTED